MEIVVGDEYLQLLSQVSSVLERGLVRARRAVEREKLQTYWEVGRLLAEHQVGARYGDAAIPRLAKDIDIPERQLYKMVQFYRHYTKVPTWAYLGWGHYREVLTLKDPEVRDYYLNEADRRGWTVRELSAQIKSWALANPPIDAPAPQSSTLPLSPLRGLLYTYRLSLVTSATEEPESFRIDMGFKIFRRVALDGLLEPKDRQVVRTVRREGAYRFDSETQLRASYYTYWARVIRVIDGDTIWLDIDCGLDTWTNEKVRLRGIDAPELDTAEGRRAADFVKEELGSVGWVGVTTTKPDKYDRYLADIFYLRGESDAQRVMDEGLFLNRELVVQGLARRVTK